MCTSQHCDDVVFNFARIGPIEFEKAQSPNKNRNVSCDVPIFTLTGGTLKHSHDLVFIFARIGPIQFAKAQAQNKQKCFFIYSIFFSLKYCFYYLLKI